ncbi:MAG TPA: HAD-IA family hydrolase [Ktedonobacterales bacterium]|nr:HAD-IA family hydrolase [Ktedonobacterales bacterium]
MTTTEHSQRLAQPQAIRAVFFDMGFTLLDVHPSIPELVAAVCARLGAPVTVAQLEAAQPQAEQLFVQSAQTWPETWGDDGAISRFWQQYYAALLRPCLPDASEGEITTLVSAAQVALDSGESYALFPDTLPTLAALKARGLTLGVVSDWGLSLGLIMRHHDLTPYFDFAVVSAAARLAKPNPGLYQLALQRANAIPDYAIHVGDSYVRDVLGARAAGVEGVLLDRPRVVRPQDVDCPLIHTLDELLPLLDDA